MAGIADDENGGVVLHKAGRVLALSGPEYGPPALELIKRGQKLVAEYRAFISNS